MMTATWFTYTLFVSIILSVLAQDPVSESTLSELDCTFSCPTRDANGLPLVKRPHVVGFNTTYSVFECVYHSSSSPHREHKCSYYKPTGMHMLGFTDDACPPTAIPCNTDNPTPQFSSSNHVDVAPWVETDRYLLYLKEHHRG